MNGFSLNRKIFREEKRSISIYFLKKMDYLKDLSIGRLLWANPRTNEDCGNISFIVDMRNLSNPILKLLFTVTSNEEQKQKLIEQKINLISTRCYFGGKRYWLECPKCLSRAGVLCLSSGNYNFYCRHCLNLSYSDRNYDHRWRLYWQMRKAEDKRISLANSIKRFYYNNKPTKIYQRYLKYRKKERDGFQMWSPFYYRMLQRMKNII